MRVHINAIVSRDVHDQVRDRIVGTVDDRDIDAAVDRVFRSSAEMIGGTDWYSAEIHVGGYPEYEIIDLDGGDAPDEHDLDLEDIRNVDAELASRSGYLDDIVAEAVKEANRDRDPAGPPVVPLSRIEELGATIPLWNWSDAEVSALLGMIDAIDNHTGADGTTVALHAMEEYYENVRFWLVVTDEAGVSRFRCDGFLAPTAQIDAALTLHPDTAQEALR